VSSVATLVGVILLTRLKPVRKLGSRVTTPLLIGSGIAAVQSVLTAVLPDSVKSQIGIAGMGLLDISNRGTPYDAMALRAYERVPTSGMGGYERTPTAGMGAIEQHLAGEGFGNAERMMDAAEAAAGIGDVIEAAAGLSEVGRYVPDLSGGLDAYERTSLSGLGATGVVGVKRPGIISSLLAMLQGKRATPQLVVQTAGGGTALVKAPIVEPIDRMAPVHARTPADMDLLPGSTLHSYAGLFSGRSSVGTPMSPY